VAGGSVNRSIWRDQSFDLRAWNIHGAGVEDDSWQPDPADFWKDGEWQTRDLIRRIDEGLEMAFAMAPRELLLKIRAGYLSDRRMTDYVEMIDRQLERRFGIRPGDSAPDS